MKDTELFSSDHQISFDLTITTIQRMFNDEIKHCRQDIDAKLAMYLEGFRDEFLSLFKHAYKDEVFKFTG